MNLRSIPLHRLLSTVVAYTVAATLIVAGPAPASAETPIKVEVQHDESVPGADRAARAKKIPATGKPFTAPQAQWPAGTAEIDIVAGSPTKAGDLPVRVGKADKQAKAGQEPVDRAKVEILDRQATAEAKVKGLLMRVSRADAKTTAGIAAIELDYSDFRHAFGADWAHRLRLVALPECALANPQPGDCAPVALVSHNDLRTQTLTADVELHSDTPMLLAVVAGTSGSSGDFAATPLQASSTWTAGGSSGDFSWSYPLRTPPALGSGPSPQVALSYSSQSVDGRMAASNNQPSWIGEGFEYSPGFIERRYTACSKDMGSGANNTVKTGDLCWDTNNATLSLNGRSTELIYESGKGWHGRTEDGSRIERKTGADNGDDNGEYWVVTTVSGTQYWFGRHQLPGWSSGKATTNSVWTAPVFGNHAGEPGHQSAFADSANTQAWRWNLDYVLDPHGNTMSLWYGTETNKYAKNNTASDLAGYTRGGYLKRIDYGTRSTNSSYGDAPMQVLFGVQDRCLTASCGTHNATNWPDTPWDSECTTSPCYVGSPTFWTTKRLSKITTRLWTGTAGSFRDVESWTMTHTFPDPGDGTRAGLWLDKISHTGHVTTAGGSEVSVPDVRFAGVQMPNRVDGIDFAAAMNWWRIAQIHTESGGSINVTYSNPECVAGTNIPAAAHNNTKRCYPVRWTPEGYAQPVTDWFHKYVVTTVTESDNTTGGNRAVTNYNYVGAPAWHYTDDDGLIAKDDKTWSVWRGYGTVRTTVGDPGEQSVTEARFFRGMHGDKQPTGSRSVTLPAAGGAPAVNDDDVYAGMTRETIAYNGAAEVSGEVTEPWQSAPTAQRTINGTTTSARFTGVGATHTRTALDGGRGNRVQSVYNTYDAYGLLVKVDDRGDNANNDDQRCAVTDYANRNTSGWLIDYPHRITTYAVACDRADDGNLTENDVMSDERTFYDNATTFGTAPVKGNATKAETVKSWANGTATGYITSSRTIFDGYGRPVESYDVRNNQTLTVYTHNTGGQLATTEATNHLGWKTTTSIEPAWGTTTKVVDPNARVTEATFDGLGRTTAVWQPGRTRGTHTANTTNTYLVRNNAPTVVTTATINAAGTYNTSHTLYDGLLRQRQTQAPEAGNSGGRIVTETIYDSAGRAFKALGPYVADGAPSTALFTATTETAIANQSLTLFDGTGRTVKTIFQPKGIEAWHTSTGYGGDRVDVTPPAGGTATSTITDVRGNTVELRQYVGDTPTGNYDSTVYTYNRKGQQTQVSDPAGNTWDYTYDLLGRKTSSDDPDQGLTTSVHNDAGDLQSTTDARGVTLAYAYDSLGRKTAVHDGTLTGTKRAEWVYDTLSSGTKVNGKPIKSIRYDNGNAYTNEITSYTTAYQIGGRKISIPAAETGLAGDYTYTHTYKADGSPATYRLPALTGLQAEILSYNYNNPIGLLTSTFTNISSEGLDTALATANYTRYGELGVIGMAYEAGKTTSVGRTYEEATRRLTRLLATRATSPGLIADRNFTYDATGNVTSQTDNLTSAVDTQCYTNDHLRRLTEAWTPADGNCSTQPDQATLGGPAPYRQSWKLDKVGNRIEQTEHNTPTGNRTTTYIHPAAGSPQPHTVTGTTTTDNNGTVNAAYSYDPAGNTLTRPGSTGTQTLTWDSEGHLATTTEATSNTRYIYDADGNRLLARDTTGKTLYLPSQELRYTTAGGTKKGTRYYTHAGQTIAQRVGSTITWLVNDQQGTALATVANTSTQTITLRRQTPYGTPRGTQPTWANDKGYLGATNDPTNLVHLGAREYDPNTGRFISRDPVIDFNDPQQINGYAYSNNSPITYSDPDGLRSDEVIAGRMNALEAIGYSNHTRAKQYRKQGEVNKQRTYEFRQRSYARQSRLDHAVFKDSSSTQSYAAPEKEVSLTTSVKNWFYDAGKWLGDKVYENRHAIVHGAITIATGAIAVAAATAFCVGTAGIGCAVMVAATVGLSVGTAGHLFAADAMGEEITLTKGLMWMADSATAGIGNAALKSVTGSTLTDLGVRYLRGER